VEDHPFGGLPVWPLTTRELAWRLDEEDAILDAAYEASWDDARTARLDPAVLEVFGIRERDEEVTGTGDQRVLNSAVLNWRLGYWFARGLLGTMDQPWRWSGEDTTAAGECLGERLDAVLPPSRFGEEQVDATREGRTVGEDFVGEEFVAWVVGIVEWACPGRDPGDAEVESFVVGFITAAVEHDLIANEDPIVARYVRLPLEHVGTPRQVAAIRRMVRQHTRLPTWGKRHGGRTTRRGG
jgi:hypothetical protein